MKTSAPRLLATVLVAALTATLLATTGSDAVARTSPGDAPIGVSSPATLDPAPPPVAFTPEEALRRDAESYATRHGVSIDEAVRRLQLQKEIGPLAAELESLLPKRLAGVWLEHSDPFRLVVWYVGTDAGLDAVRGRVAGAPLPVEIRSGATNSLAGLVEISDSIPGALGPDARLAGRWVDVKTGTVRVDLQPDSPLAPQTASLRETLSAQYGAPIEITVLSEAMRDDTTYGGARLEPTCTSGFTVKNSNGATGVATAKHCDNSLTFYDGGTPYATTFVAELQDAYRDVQWSSVVGEEIPYFFNGGFVRVTGRITRTNQVIGNTYCHYGKTTGYSCGELTSKTYAPSYPGACGGVPCASTWMVAAGGFAADGDSGGPWFSGGAAAGIHKTSFGPSGYYGVYMAIDFMDALGVTLLEQ